MTLTDLRGPIAIGEGGLVVLDHGRLDPLLAEAVLLLRVSQGAEGEVWANEGTGSGLAASPTSPNYTATEAPPLLDPDHGALQAVSFSTGTTSFTTPDSAALDLTGPVDIRWACRAIGDATGGGTAFFHRIVDKWLGPADETSCYGAGITLVDDGNLVAACYATWTAPLDPVTPDLPGGLTAGAYAWGEHRVVLETGLEGDPAGRGWTYTNRLTSYVRDDADPDDVTDDGKGWRQIVNTDPRHAVDAQGRTVAEGGETIGPGLQTGTGPLVFMRGQGVAGYCEVYDGIDGTLVADCNPARDATHGATSWVSGTTGETWTAQGGARVFDGSRPAFACSKFAYYSIADDPLLDFDATDDFTVAAVVRPAASDAAFSIYCAKSTGQPGAPGGVGYALAQAASVGGEAGLIFDGDPSLAASANATATDLKVVAVTVDRSAAEVTHWLDATPDATPGDTTAVGSLVNAGPTLIGADMGTNCPALVEAVAVWGRVLTAGEVAHLSDLWS